MCSQTGYEMSDQPYITEPPPEPILTGPKKPGNPAWKGVKGKSGPPGNQNAAKHFTRARITLSNLPPAFHQIQRGVNEIRRALEDACEEAHGGISLPQASTINTATWAERLLRLWARRLAHEYDKLDAAGVALATDRIERLCKTRDDAIRRLDLDSDDNGSPWASIYSKPAYPHPALAIPPVPSASGSAASNPPPASIVRATEPVGEPKSGASGDASESDVEGGDDD